MLHAEVVSYAMQVFMLECDRPVKAKNIEGRGFVS